MACSNERRVKQHFDQLTHIRIRQLGNVFLVRNDGFVQIKIFRKKILILMTAWRKNNVFLFCRISAF